MRNRINNKKVILYKIVKYKMKNCIKKTMKKLKVINKQKMKKQIIK